MPLYDALARLTLQVDNIAIETLELKTKSGWLRKSSRVRLRGKGFEGVGEDVTYQPGEHRRLFALETKSLCVRDSFDRWTRRLDKHGGMNRRAADPKAALYRRWAFESAAIDLALKQAGLSFAEVLRRKPKPLRYVVSTTFNPESSFSGLERLRAFDQTMKFKIDAHEGWDESLIARLHKFGGVATVDLKGQYKGPFEGMPAELKHYQRLFDGFPNAIMEDPSLDKDFLKLVQKFKRRVSFDANICSLSDILALPFEPKHLNLKPSRFGRLCEYLRVVEYCQARDISIYAGGQFELDVGRDHIQYLASLFHPDAPNDCSPRAFHGQDWPDSTPKPMFIPPIAETGFCFKPPVK